MAKKAKSHRRKFTKSSHNTKSEAVDEKKEIKEERVEEKGEILETYAQPSASAKEPEEKQEVEPKPPIENIKNPAEVSASVAPPITQVENIQKENISQTTTSQEGITVEKQVEGESIASEESGGSNVLWKVIIAGLVLGAVVGGVFLYKNKTNPKELISKKGESALASPVTQPVVEEVDLFKYSIKILNGSGIEGEASKARELILGGGFNVDSIGNAQRYDYSQTIIQAKIGLESEYLDKLKATLEKTYIVSGTSELTEDELVDVIIIIGSGKSES